MMSNGDPPADKQPFSKMLGAMLARWSTIQLRRASRHHSAAIIHECIVDTVAALKVEHPKNFNRTRVTCAECAKQVVLTAHFDPSFRLLMWGWIIKGEQNNECLCRSRVNPQIFGGPESIDQRHHKSRYQVAHLQTAWALAHFGAANQRFNKSANHKNGKHNRYQSWEHEGSCWF